MTKRLLLIVFLTLGYAEAQERPLVLEHVNIVDVVEGKLIGDMSVTIEGGLIRSVAKTLKIPEGAQVIDATDKYLIPGLWDMHTHLSFYGVDAFPLLIANGVTGVRDMGGKIDELDLWEREIASGKRLGPRIKKSGSFMDGPKKMNAVRASFTVVIQTADEVKPALDKLLKDSVDFIKVHSRLPREAFFVLAAQCRIHGIPFAVHLPKDVSPIEASAVGARSIEHAESLLSEIIYDEDEERRQQKTEAMLDTLNGGYGLEIANEIARNGNFYDPTVVSLFKVKGTAYERWLAPRLIRLITILYNAGVPLLAGSDFATKEAGIIPGVHLHDELELLTKAGLKPYEALKAATINAAECLFLQDSTGTVEPGKWADLVLLDADPLKDIANSRKIHAVIANGRLIFPADIPIRIPQ